MKKISDEDWEKIFGLKKEDREQEEFQEFLKHMEELRDVEVKEKTGSENTPKKISIPKKTRLNLDDEIDLHGLTREEAKRKLEEFFLISKQEKLKIVLVITGKGKHSEKGASLKPFVEKWIKTEGSIYVKSYGIAPKLHGGEGAIVVFLK